MWHISCDIWATFYNVRDILTCCLAFGSGAVTTCINDLTWVSIDRETNPELLHAKRMLYR